MNLLIIGKDVDQIAMKAWAANTNYTVLNMSPYLWGPEFKKFYKKHDKLIVTSTAGQFLARNVDDFIALMKEYNFIPIFIAEDKDAIERCMHTNVEEVLPYSVVYIGNEKSEKYPELIDILQGYLLGKGFSIDGDNIVQTSRKGERTTIKE